MVILEVFHEQITLSDGHWIDPPAAVRADLDTVLAQAVTQLPAGYVPDYDLALAEIIERTFHARILSHTATRLPKGTVA